MSNEKKQQDTSQTADASELAQPVVVQDANSPGQQLRIAREKLGLTQQQVADRLHLRITSVEAVESDSLEQGVSVTFTKGYVRLYAKLVHLEVDPLLAAYDQLHSKEREPAKLQSFSRRVSREAHDHRWNMVSIVVVLLVIGSIIFWWVDREGYFNDSGLKVSQAWETLVGEEEAEQAANIDSNNKLEDTSSDVKKLNTGPNIPEEEVASIVNKVEETSNDTADTIDESIDDTEEVLSASVDELEDTANTLADATSDAVDSATEQLSSEPDTPRNSADIVEGVFTDAGYKVNADGTVNVEFTFTEDCWVSVKDANGDTMAVGVKKKGRVMDVAGLPPVRVILGAPSAVEIDFGGQRIDMSVYPGGESAKFSLPIESE